MKTNKALRHFVVGVLVVLVSSAAFSVFASITGSISATDHDIVLNNSNANYNRINCSRSLVVTEPTVKGSNTMTWYSFSGTTVQKAYCNACTGTSKVTVRGHDGDNNYITPKSTTVDVLGLYLEDGITCTALRHHNLDLVAASAEFKVYIYSPDGNVLYTYSKTMSIN